MCGITACVTLEGCNSLASGRLNGHFANSSSRVNGHGNGTSQTATKGAEATKAVLNGGNGSLPHDTPDGHGPELVNEEQQSEYGLAEKRKKVENQLKASVKAIQHRGPDESGVWVSPDASVGLGHCRLSIHDLSPSGAQPLESDDGKIHAIVNGEIYDHDRLRKYCATEHGYKFKGESDSELVLALYKIYGAPEFFKHLRGEFAFVLHDGRAGKERVIAARDRYGIKPMVMTVSQGRLLLAAEAKAFLAMGWKPEWDVNAIVEAGWMIDNRTVFKGVQKLLPGQWVDITREKGLQISSYWDANYADKTTEDPRTIEEMVQGVRDRLVEAIRLRMRADVPLGVYLSGGIDSSAVAGIVTKLAQEENVQIGGEGGRTRVACFSVRFPEESGYDESSIADRTAKWLGVETVKRDVDESTLARDFAEAIYHCEHHHNDLNFVAKFALSTLPQEHGVKVVLTGEGADEHFAGYPYFPAEFLREPDLSQPNSPLATQHELRHNMQRTLDLEMKKIFRNIGFEGYPEGDVISELNESGMPETLLAWHPTTTLFSPAVQERYKAYDLRRTVANSHSPEVLEKIQRHWHPLHTAMYLWNKSQLANVLLSCLGDKTEMAHSIEARTPFLDHHLTEYINSLPPSVKMGYTPVEDTEANDQGPLWQDVGKARRSLTEKWIMREAVRPFITQELYERRKHPFLAPTRWPRDGPLHKMLVQVLAEEKVRALGFVDYATVKDNLERAFGDSADSRSFRNLLFVAAWVTLSERFGVQTATDVEL